MRQIRAIPDLRAFNQFLALAAAHHGQEFNAATLSRELGISQPTVKAWAGVVEASYVGLFLPPWHRNYGKRIVKTPKFYFTDSALVNLLTRQPNAAAALAGSLGGALLEGWIVAEAAKAYMARGRKPDIYFWRSHDGLEVDVLLVLDGRLYPVEAKLTATPSAGHVEPLRRFIRVAGGESADSGLIVCRTPQARMLPGGHTALPWGAFPQWLEERLGAR